MQYIVDIAISVIIEADSADDAWSQVNNGVRAGLPDVLDELGSWGMNTGEPELLEG